MTPQEQHIKVTYQIREMRAAEPPRESPKADHVAHTQKWLALLDETERRNCQLRLVAEMFYYLANKGTVLLHNTKFRDTVIAKMKEIDEMLCNKPEDYAVRQFYNAAEALKYKIALILGQYHTFTLKGRPYY
jgi:hypothetical protein